MAYLRLLAAVPLVCLFTLAASAEPPAAPPPPAGPPDKVYVPYQDLKDVLRGERQGVFLPYDQFEQLWRSAQAAPAGMAAAPAAYLINAARFTGSVSNELATLHLDLTIDVLGDDWVVVPLKLSGVAVTKAVVEGQGGDADAPAPGEAPADKPAAAAPTLEPLLRVVNGQYQLLTRGRGRRTVRLDFVRQVVADSGLNKLALDPPAAAITTLELVIPEENMKVDVKPMLAASTRQIDREGKRVTQLQAFLGGQGVELSWQPTTQAADDLDAVVICEQLQHLHVAEALISYDVTFDYDIRRRGLDTFNISLPASFRVTSVDGANIARWRMLTPTSQPAGRAADTGPQVLEVKLFSPARDSYTLKVHMESFVKDATLTLPLTEVRTQQVLRRSGLIAVSHTPRRSVAIEQGDRLARVDVGRLPQPLQGQPAVVAYRFLSDYGDALALKIDSVQPRVEAVSLLSLGVDAGRLSLGAQLHYQIERVGVFQLTLDLPEPWQVLAVRSIEPADIVDNYQFSGQGDQRKLVVLLKREVAGPLRLAITAEQPRADAQAPVKLVLPLADPLVTRRQGQLVLLVSDQLNVEVDKLDGSLSPLPLSRSAWTPMDALSPAMAYSFRTSDAAEPVRASFKPVVRPTQLSAQVSRLVNIMPGSIEQEAVIDYRVSYAPVDTFYIKMPARLADQGVEINGPDIKEMPRIDALPADQAEPVPPTTSPDVNWAYFKVVLQRPVKGDYRLKVSTRQAFQPPLARADQPGEPVVVEPILPAGKLTDQSGQVAIAKADTLSIGQPTVQNLIAADPANPADLPYQPHRDVATLAFKYSAPPFSLSLPVAMQPLADVYTAIANAAIVEQVIGRDGACNAHVTWLLSTSRSDRLPIDLPPNAQVTSVRVNGQEVSVEKQPGSGDAGDKLIVRLPASAGQVNKVVLEVGFGLPKAKLGELRVASLPKDLPVQQTLWMLWLPREDRPLWFSDRFAPITASKADMLLNRLGEQGYPVRVARRLAGQGQALHFQRQGPADRFSLAAISGPWFSVIVWAVVLAVGLLMLPLSGYARSMLVLLFVLVGGVAWLFAEPLVRGVVETGSLAAVIVLGLWLVHWLFVRVPRRLRRPEAKVLLDVPVAQPVAQAGDAGGKE